MQIVKASEASGHPLYTTVFLFPSVAALDSQCVLGIDLNKEDSFIQFEIFFFYGHLYHESRK